MNYHSRSHESSSSLFAFVVGIATTVAIGGYFLFGPHGRQNRRNVDRWLNRMTVAVLDRMEDIEDLTEEKYQSIVDEVTLREGQLRGFSSDLIAKFRENLKQRWGELHEVARKARAEALRKVEAEERNRRMIQEKKDIPYIPPHNEDSLS